MNAIPDLVRQEIEREVGPMRQQAALRSALDKAVQLQPLVIEQLQFVVLPDRAILAKLGEVFLDFGSVHRSLSPLGSARATRIRLSSSLRLSPMVPELCSHP